MPGWSIDRPAEARGKAGRDMMTAMTKKEIDAILDRVRMWPRPRQEDAARILLAMEAQEPSVYRLSEEERADIETSLEELASGEVALDEEVKAVFDRYRR
jgi:hypothetical protein